jgi:hypothetical protein
LGTSSPLNGNILSDDVSTSLVPAEWGVTSVRCVDLNGYEAAAARNARLKATVRKFFNNTIYPTPQTILATGGATLHDILAPNVRSRISPAGAFDGFEGVVEYFYGFVATPGNLVTSIDVRSLVAEGNTVAAKVNIFLTNTNFAQSGGFPPQFYNLSIFGFFTFDNTDKIASIDVSVPNLGKLLDSPIPQINAGKIVFMCTVLTRPSAFSSNASGTCGWLNPFAGWSSTGNQTEACIAYMNSIPYGSYNRMNANNFVCRFLHGLLTPYAPGAHCPHVTPASTPTACVDFTYQSFFQVDY